jgi:hypothetical protein
MPKTTKENKIIQELGERAVQEERYKHAIIIN